MAKQSAGFLVFRRRGEYPEVFLVHPGGPFWAGKDIGAWSIPKGEFGPGEDPLEAAHREFQEEIGVSISGQPVPLTPLKQPSGKIIHAWAVEGDVDASSLKSNTFSMEWPPHSGKQQEFPEVDQAEWFGIETAKSKITKGQIGLLDQLSQTLNIKVSEETGNSSNTISERKGERKEHVSDQDLLF